MASLGKGLSALISTPEPIERKTEKKVSQKPKQNMVGSDNDIPYLVVDINRVEPNAFQPRIVITEESLSGLVESIKEHGFFSPILVKEKGDKYMIIAGERRWRAAKLAGCKEISIVVNNSDDPKLMGIALVENLQRKDLNPLEEAIAYDHLRKDFNMSLREIAQKVGFSQEHVGHKLKLLKLPVSIQELVLQEKLTPQHTDAIEKLGNEAAMMAVSKMVLRDRLSAEKTADLVQKLLSGIGASMPSTPTEEFKQKYQYVLDDIKNKMGFKASLARKHNGGATLSISFSTEDEIKDFYSKINSLKEEIE